MLYGGVVADRVPRHRLLVVTQSTMLLLALVLAALSYSQLVQPWHVVLLALLLGTVNAFDAPAGGAFVFDLVECEDVTNAIALNSSQFNLATVVGPTVAGLTYAAFGPAWCFGLNGVSYLAVIAALLLMRLPAREPAAVASSAFTQLKQGVRYTLGHPILRSLVVIQGVTALFGMAYATLLPAWAVAVLGGNATTNGLLQSARRRLARRGVDDCRAGTPGAARTLVDARHVRISGPGARLRDHPVGAPGHGGARRRGLE